MFWGTSVKTISCRRWSNPRLWGINVANKKVKNFPNCLCGDNVVNKKLNNSALLSKHAAFFHQLSNITSHKNKQISLVRGKNIHLKWSWHETLTFVLHIYRNWRLLSTHLAHCHLHSCSEQFGRHLLLSSLELSGDTLK